MAGATLGWLATPSGWTGVYNGTVLTLSLIEKGFAIGRVIGGTGQVVIERVHR
jgi:hypothetical protein